MEYNTGPTPGQGGFFASLFDLSFRSFVTPKVIGVLYVISIVILALYTLVLIVLAFNVDEIIGIFTLLIFAPLFLLLSVIYVRVLLELAIILFRISENTSEMVRQGRR